jgi:hypothetical protein
MRGQLDGVLWGALLSVWITSATAADVSVAPFNNDPERAIVLVTGTLTPGDDAVFRGRVGPLTRAVVVFNSDGGNLLAGIAIGKIIRLKSFATAVWDGQRCASACALAWLGGSQRLMGRSALVGFHAAYIEQQGQTMETGVGNALVGSYLNQIGLSERAVVYITGAAPAEMTWLNLRDAQQIGIDVKVFEQPTAAKPPKNPNVVSRQLSSQELAERARSFVSTVMSQWSRGNAAALAALHPLYATEVDYYGNRLSHDDVLADKRRFSERWPERTYKVQSSYAECNASQCFVDGYLGWETRSPTRKAVVSGDGSFYYVLIPSGATFLIMEENGKVFHRTQTTLSEPPQRQ